MIQFVGVHLGLGEVRAASIGRDLRLWARSSTRLVNARPGEDARVTEVPPAEWVRSGCFCLHDTYLKLPVPARKVWGIGLSAPQGWIALDNAFDPLGPLRITGDVPALDDIKSWLAAEPRNRNRIRAILSAKDYFRFAVSGGLATDVTTAGHFGLLAEGTTQWAPERVEAAELQLDWLPPIFDCEAPTGRLSAEGVTQTRLPAGLWMVAGARDDEAVLLAGGDLREATLWSHSLADGRRQVAYGLAHLDAITPPVGWSLQRSALAGHQILTRPIDAAASDLTAYQRTLEEAGFSVTTTQEAHGAPELGAALLAGIGSKLIRRWEKFYVAAPDRIPSSDPANL